MRIVNRLLAALLSLALIAVGALVVIEVVADRLNHRPAIVHWHNAYAWAARTEWRTGSVRVSCVALIAVGLVLLVAELKRPRVARLAVAAPADGPDATVDTAYTRRGVAAAIRSAVGEVDGIASAAVAVSRRSVTVRATAAAQNDAAARALAEPARAAAEQRLHDLDLRSAPRLSVRVNPGRS